VSSYLEVLDAQRVSFQAELDLNQATRDELVNAVLLYRALGGGWEHPMPPQAGANEGAKEGAPPATPAPAPAKPAS
jgi:outer membrane protein TolC